MAKTIRIIESVETHYEVRPLDGQTFEEVLHLLQNDVAQPLIDPDTGEKGVYIPTPKQHPGVKKIAALKPTRDRHRTITYGD